MSKPTIKYPQLTMETVGDWRIDLGYATNRIFLEGVNISLRGFLEHVRDHYRARDFGRSFVLWKKETAKSGEIGVTVWMHCGMFFLSGSERPLYEPYVNVHFIYQDKENPVEELKL